MLRIFLLLIIGNLVAFSAVLNIASGAKDANYYVLAKSMNNIARKSKNQKIIPIITKGSVENIKKLLSKKVDLAIVQNNIAFFAKNAHQPFVKYNENLRLVLPLFKEPIFIITNQKGINSLSQLRHKKIAIGDRESGLSESAKVILNVMSLLDTIQVYQIPESLAITKLQKKSLDAIFVNNLTPYLKDQINQEKLFIVPIPKSFIYKLKKTFPYFETHKFILLNKESISTVAVRSILITRNDVDSSTIYAIMKLLVQHYDELIFPDAYHTNINELFKIDTQLDWHNGAKEYFSEHHIITSSDKIFNKYFWYIFIASLFSIVALIFVFMLVLYRLGWLNRLNNSQRLVSYLQKIYFYTFKYKYILLLSFIILSYSIAVLIIKYFEHSWAIEHNVISVFDENPFFESSLWLFIFGATGYNGDFFPNSSEGKLLVSLIPMFGLGGFFALIGFITSDQIKKYILEAKGMVKINFNNHIIVCGWNDKTKLLIENLTHDNLSVKKDLVILTDNLDYNPVEKYNFNSQFVKYVYGSATDRESLDKANIADAATAIIIADATSSDPDARTILSILAIEKYSDKLLKENKRNKDIYTIAEIIDPANAQIANDADVDQVISLGDIESKIFTQSIQNPGVIKFVNEIFTYDNNNDIYSIDIVQGCKLIGKNYDEILFLLRKYEILLLSINIEANRTKENVEKLCNEYKLARAVITNPIDINEENYKLMENDSLIVLAQYENNITESLQQIKKEC